MNKKTIIFDADGTLLDSLWVWDNLVLDYLIGKEIKAEKDLRDSLWAMSFNDGIYYIKEKYNLSESFDEINLVLQANLKNSYLNEVKLFDGVISLLESLSNKNYSLLVASASDKKLLKLCFSKHNILKYFDSIITEREYKTSKANKEFFTYLIDKHNLSLSETILVDDAIHSLKAANSLNIKTIGILNGNDKDLFSPTCTLLINTIGELNEKSINNCWK